MFSDSSFCRTYGLLPTEPQFFWQISVEKFFIFNHIVLMFLLAGQFVNFYAPKRDYYAGIMLVACTIVLCSKLCRHNLSNPIGVLVRKEFTIESTMVQSAINVEETLETTRYSAVGVKH